MADVYGESPGKGSVVKLTAEKGLEASSIVSCDLFDPDDTTVFLLDFNAANSERFATLPCFGDTNYVFTFGHDINASRSSVTMLVFIGSANCEPGDSTGRASNILSKYAEKRISKEGEKISVQICGNGGFSSGYLVSMQIRSYSPALNAVTITATFMTDEPA